MAGKQGSNFLGVGGPGRKKGTKDKRVFMLEEILASKKSYAHLFEDGIFTGSACFWIEVMEDKKNALQTRLKASEYLSKYLNYSKPVLTETNFTTDLEDKSFAVMFAKAQERKDMNSQRYTHGLSDMTDVINMDPEMKRDEEQYLLEQMASVKEEYRTTGKVKVPQDRPELIELEEKIRAAYGGG